MKIFKYGDDVNTDVIFPGKYTYTITDPYEMAKHALEDLDPDFAKTVEKGDIIVAGKNFGCGSSREQAATCIKYAGVDVIVAKSFSRIFYRNCINSGLLAIECPDVVDKITKDSKIEINREENKLIVDGVEYSYPPIPVEVRDIIDAGGLIPYLQQKFKKD
ncbi:3-isopropylmalate/(R)-2-methylmalate dehydratase small subunit [Thermotomaculum hydrothermale]|uniref:3-isopropylmalate/(R)-2-methylmalate dehydratase small subunit n=1 Tax=Thermotomaculum hydrothermale TaxID=981385 RepID=A0A7R6PJ30_9BACT|nr:3-isopropylmalate dehydratase small subunit [Thermotomaculum hydrothermale]BBB33519.1 3-isopropylmalate/(R)-2-methylmalate dehydratase small subunit [Thermotomaculum hydrothermale]